MNSCPQQIPEALVMEETESTVRQRSTGEAGPEEAGRVLGTNKPLHRFVQKEPRVIGVALVIFGSAELLMGFTLAEENFISAIAYVPFWQGALFLVCGILSIYTELHPSKKMVTVCLAMYVISILSILVSVVLRASSPVNFVRYHSLDGPWAQNHYTQVRSIESILLATSLCVFGLLIFLSTIARLALKSSRTQLIVHHVPPPQEDISSD